MEIKGSLNRKKTDKMITTRILKESRALLDLITLPMDTHKKYASKLQNVAISSLYNHQIKKVTVNNKSFILITKHDNKVIRLRAKLE